MLLVVLLIALLPSLAIMQYRWLGKISEGERERMQASLRISIDNFCQDVDRELTRAFLAFQIDPEIVANKDWRSYQEHWQQWQRSSNYPKLIQDVYIVIQGPNSSLILRKFDKESGDFKDAEWPNNFSTIRQHFQEEIDSLQNLFPVRVNFQSVNADIPAVTVPFSFMPPIPSMVITTDEQINGKAITENHSANVVVSPRMIPQFGYTVLAIDRDYLIHEFLPKISEKYFLNNGSFDYHVTISDKSDPKNIIYQDSNNGLLDPAQSDATGNLLRVRFDEFDKILFARFPGKPSNLDTPDDRSGDKKTSANNSKVKVDSDHKDINVGGNTRVIKIEGTHQEVNKGNANISTTKIEHSFGTTYKFDHRDQTEQYKNGSAQKHSAVISILSSGDLPAKSNFKVAQFFNNKVDEDIPWQILVKHRSGSLDIAVAIARQRSLILSFGILIILSVTMSLLIISTRRAQGLARQQMEFVAGVSHELRTPLAVICSAGENLADGVINEKQQVKRYGDLIKTEGRRLTEMVEQILEFAGWQANRKAYQLQPVDVSDVITRATEVCQPLINEHSFILEIEIAKDLPLITADAPALQRALQNLINNAVKYSGDAHWLSIKAQLNKGLRQSVVSITIADHGIGIPAEELPHIFDPFYRGQEVTAAQIHGSGLGLSIVKQIVEAFGGSISVESSPSKGSAFTLHLPLASAVDESKRESAKEKYEQADFASGR